MENTVAEFAARVRAYNHDKEEINRIGEELLNHATENLQSLILKTVEIKTKYRTYTGTVQEFVGYPRKEYIRLNPCTTGAVSIHLLSIYNIKEIQ